MIKCISAFTERLDNKLMDLRDEYNSLTDDERALLLSILSN